MNSLLLLNGSPRGERSNTMKMLSRVAEGWERGGGQAPEILHLARKPGFERAVEAFAQADVVLLGMPLYTDTMPSIVKFYIEAIGSSAELAPSGSAKPAALRGCWPASTRMPSSISHTAITRPRSRRPPRLALTRCLTRPCSNRAIRSRCSFIRRSPARAGCALCGISWSCRRVYNLDMGAMSNLQLYIAVGLPVIAVLTSLVISLVQISALRDEMRGIREDMRMQNSAVREDIHAQIVEIREDIREIRSDIKLLTGKVYELMGQK